MDQKKVTTGRFATRKQLEKFVTSSATRKKAPLSKLAIAADAQVSYGVVTRILQSPAAAS